MHTHDLSKWQHDHRFAAVDRGNEQRTAMVVWLTAITMVVEIVAGTFYGSMALLADGWHMGTHVAALALSVLAYRHARRHADDRRYTFGTGKVGVLGGYTSAVALAIVAVLMGAESAQRFFHPQTIQFNQAILVAAIGLLVNLLSALLLRGDHDHEHSGHAEAPHSHDHNLRAAYLHVMADALTSILAIAALLAAKYLGYIWMDPVMGMVGGVLIAWWSVGLLRDTSRILLDSSADPEVLASIRSAIESNTGDKVSDLHLWKVGPDTFSAIISVVTQHPKPPDYYKALLAGHDELAHITVEVHQCSDETCAPTENPANEL
jgi:cation diffusion facilitator family transporter